ncbi:MAG: phosphopentomutase [Bacillota bacterium]
MDASRIILIVLDSVGIGALPDADEYGDQGADTLGHIAAKVQLDLPHLESLGLGKIRDLPGILSDIKASGVYGKMAEKSVGKDTTTGHWELAGLITEKSFPVYPEGFPEKIIQEFENKTGLKVLGNKPASGTEIIEELGEKHLATGYPIVYTSADSVFQVAAHKQKISVQKLYQICRKARKILTGEHAVARVIARPFTGQPGNFERTEERKDFSLSPPEETMLDKIKNDGYSVTAVGKINDIFTGQGISSSIAAKSNREVVDTVVRLIEEKNEGLIFANLVEFDMNFGHRRDVEGYARALEKFDNRIPEITAGLKKNDVLIITADHGCDPTFRGTDHTREYVPLLIMGERIVSDYNPGIRKSFADLAATVVDLLGVKKVKDGTSFAQKIWGGVK